MQITTPDDLKQLGTIMGVWAHPDDEVMTSCGLLCAAIKNGQQVVCITATKGEAGVIDPKRWPQHKLGSIRAKELQAAYKQIGLKDHHYLDLPDGGCAGTPEELVIPRLVSLMNAYEPDTIITFAPDGLTGHPDHQTVSNWAGLANRHVRKTAAVYHATLTVGQYRAYKDIDRRFNFFFNIDRPTTCREADCDIRFKLDDGLYDCKLRCLDAMPSQYEAVLEEFRGKLRPCLETEAFVRA